MFERDTEIVFMSFKAPIKELTEFSQTCGINIKQIYYKDIFEIEAIIRDLAKKGVKTIVGPTLVYLAAQKYNIDVIVYYSAEVFRRAFNQAIHIAYSQRKIKYLLEQYETISNLTNIGVISCNAQGIITHVNERATQIFDLKGENIYNSYLDRIFPGFDFSLLKKAEENKITGKLIRVKNKELIVSVFPIMVNSFSDGFVLSFQESKEISTAENLIRKKAKYSFTDIIGHNILLKNTIAKARSFAKTDYTILIQGESGTGKELLAHAIHNASNRRGGPFLSINCMSLPESLLESELFGYEEGAFTGSRKEGKIGLFELCHSGTLFIDEIGDLTPTVQIKILRFIEEKEILRVGGNELIPVDIRIIAATNKDLKNEVFKGNFRLDLFKRISILTLNTIPLRKMRDNIPELLEFFLKKHNAGENPLDSKIIKYVVEKLIGYHWPGNIRELEALAINLLVEERINYLNFNTVNKIIEKFIIVEENRLSTQTQKGLKVDTISEILRETNNNKSEAARRLGISRTTLWRLTKKV